MPHYRILQTGAQVLKSSKDLPEASLVNLARFFFHRARLVNTGTGLARATLHTLSDTMEGNPLHLHTTCKLTARVWECNKEIRDTLVTLLQVVSIKYPSTSFPEGETSPIPFPSTQTIAVPKEWIQ